MYNDERTLIFPNGAVISIEYDKNGNWVIDVEEKPSSGAVEVRGLGHEETRTDYTEVAIVSSPEPIEYVYVATGEVNKII